MRTRNPKTGRFEKHEPRAFKVGDRVVLRRGYKNRPTGSKGVVTGVSGGKTSVEWEKHVGFTYCANFFSESYDPRFRPSNLELIDSKPAPDLSNATDQEIVEAFFDGWEPTQTDLPAARAAFARIMSKPDLVELEALTHTQAERIKNLEHQVEVEKDRSKDLLLDRNAAEYQIACIRAMLKVAELDLNSFDVTSAINELLNR